MFDDLNSDEITQSADTISSVDLEHVEIKEVAPTSYYVDKVKLNAALRDWKIGKQLAEANNTELPSLPDYAARSIIEIATNISRKWNFRGYSFREEMVGDAILNVLKYIGNYDPDASTRSGTPNPFWYISRMCINTFKFRIGSEERQQYYKMAIVSHMADELIGDEDFTSVLPNGTTSAREMFQDMQSKASSYEDKQTIKKTAKKKLIQDAFDGMSEEEKLLQPVSFSLTSIFT